MRVAITNFTCSEAARTLATMIAVPLLRNNTQKVQELEQLYRAAIPSALAADANEGGQLEKTDAWIEARAGGVS